MISKLTRLAGLSALGAIVLAAASARAETPLERGAYLMNAVVACGNCHTQQTPEGPLPGMELAGGMVIDFPDAFVAHVPNITPDPETGIGSWSDEDIVRAVRQGVRPDGSLIGPPMPIGLYRDMSDEDVMALVAYLRSVPPVKNAVPKSEYKIPLPPSYGPPVVSVSAVDPSDKVAYGAYLAGPAAHCIECHSPPGEHGEPDWMNNAGAGGFVFPGPWGESVSANITPTNLGGWSDEQIKTVIRTGVRPDGSHLLPPMGIYYYANMKESDLDALVAYLRSLPPR